MVGLAKARPIALNQTHARIGIERLAMRASQTVGSVDIVSNLRRREADQNRRILADPAIPRMRVTAAEGRSYLNKSIASLIWLMRLWLPCSLSGWWMVAIMRKRARMRSIVAV